MEAYGPPETFQLEIYSTDTTPSYNVNLCGLYNIVMTGFSIQFSTDPAFAHIAISSPQLTLNHFVSNSSTGSQNAQFWSVYFPLNTHNTNALKQRVYFGDKFIQNQIQVSIINADNGTALANFQRALLTFEVRRKH
jgi:hypothetical protein